jgi:hypothetical protein
MAGNTQFPPLISPFPVVCCGKCAHQRTFFGFHSPLRQLNLTPFLIVVVVVIAAFTVTPARGQDISLTYAIEEEQVAGALVGDIARDSNIRELVGSDLEFRDLRWSFLQAGAANVSSNFHLQPDSGTLTTARRLDREILCRWVVVDVGGGGSGGGGCGGGGYGVVVGGVDDDGDDDSY